MIWLLRLSCFTVFFGRAWQHLFQDAPFRSFFWDEEILSGFVTKWLGMTWNEYATSAVVDSLIQVFTRAHGVLYLVCAILSLTVKKEDRIAKAVLAVGAFALFILAALYCKEKFYQAGQFFEYSAQFGAPVLLLWAVSVNESSARFEATLRLCVALTFICHGLYAYGYYSVPGEFVDMTIEIMKLTESQSYMFLKVCGVLDFLIGAAILSNIAKPYVLCYAMAWGTLTALARVVSNVSIHQANFGHNLFQWAPEVIFRLPHALLPAAALFCGVQLAIKKRNEIPSHDADGIPNY